MKSILLVLFISLPAVAQTTQCFQTPNGMSCITVPAVQPYVVPNYNPNAIRPDPYAVRNNTIQTRCYQTPNGISCLTN